MVKYFVEENGTEFRTFQAARNYFMEMQENPTESYEKNAKRDPFDAPFILAKDDEKGMSAAIYRMGGATIYTKEKAYNVMKFNPSIFENK